MIYLSTLSSFLFFNEKIVDIFYLLISTIVAGFSLRATTLVTKIIHPNSLNWGRLTLGFLNVLAMIAIFIWCISNFAWYAGAPLFFVFISLSVIPYNFLLGGEEQFLKAYKASPALHILTIFIAVFLWLL